MCSDKPEKPQGSYFSFIGTDDVRERAEIEALARNCTARAVMKEWWSNSPEIQEEYKGEWQEKMKEYETWSKARPTCPAPRRKSASAFGFQGRNGKNKKGGGAKLPQT
jgi:hypothetical protein